jgi:ribonuclease VapC
MHPLFWLCSTLCRGRTNSPAEALSSSAISTVSLAEVQSKLGDRGLSPGNAWAAARSMASEAIDFTTEHAKTAGSLIAETCSLGLSLGDRAGLAPGLAQKAPVYTADRSWKNLKLGVRIQVIR